MNNHIPSSSVIEEKCRTIRLDGANVLFWYQNQSFCRRRVRVMNQGGITCFKASLVKTCSHMKDLLSSLQTHQMTCAHQVQLPYLV